MEKKLYKLMNWAAIEEIIYSECDHPQDLLGPHTKGNATLIQAFYPGADSVTVLWSEDGKQTNRTAMELADDDGYYAILVPVKALSKYQLEVAYRIPDAENPKIHQMKTVICGDPYNHKHILAKNDLDKMLAGNHYAIQQRLGSHVMTHGGELGTYFAVWAPDCVRVSVVGDFNNWDGRTNQMMRIADTGYFELFIPGVEAGAKYQYELKLRGDHTYLKADPYASFMEGAPACNSIVTSDICFEWTDEAFLKKRKKANPKEGTLSIYKANASAFHALGDLDQLPNYLAKQNYTHILIPSVLRKSAIKEDDPISMFAMDASIGKPEDFCAFVNACHEYGISVIIDFNASCFAMEGCGLGLFDGTCLYEHLNPKQGMNAEHSSFLWNYGRNEVKELLISSALNLLSIFHLDGLRFRDLASMLYLDYGKTDGEWIANMYGGNENLEAISLLGSMREQIKKQYPGVLLFADDNSAHPMVTDSTSEGGLGFDLKLNYGFSSDFCNYITWDPIYRSKHHQDLTNELVYAFVDEAVITLPTVAWAGDEKQQAAQEKLELAYLFMHPGKKMVRSYMDSNNPALMYELNNLLKKHNVLSINQRDPESFEWLSNMNADGCYISFVRKSSNPEDMLVAVANFSGASQVICTGVPYEGKYKEILNTDAKKYGGSGMVHTATLAAQAKSADGRAQSLSVEMAPLSMAIFQFIPYTKEEVEKVIADRIRQFTPIKKSK